MVTPELTENVKRKLESGLSPENIETILTKNGWKKEDVDEALKGLNHPAASAGAEASPAAQSPAPDVAGSQPALSNVSTAAPTARSGMRKNLAWILCVVAVLVLGGGYFAYGYYESLPSVALPKAALNLANLSTLHYDGQVSLSFKNSTPSSTAALSIPAEDTAYVLSFDTETDLKSRVTDTTASVESQSTSGISSSTTLASLEFRAIQSIVYIQLLTIPDLGPFNIDKLKNQWIKIDPDAITAQMKQLGIAVGSSTTSDISKFDSLGSDQIKNAIDIEKKYKLFDPARYLGQEDIDGKPAFHYASSLNMKNVIAYLGEAEKAVPGSFPPDSVNNLKETIQGDPHIDIWIARGTGYPAKTVVSFDFGNPSLLGTAAMHANMMIHFQNFNEPVDIAAPANSIDIVDVFKSFYNATSVSPFAGPPTAAQSANQAELFKQGRDSNRVSDVITLKTAIAFYAANVSSPILCAGKNAIYSSAKITPPPGWTAGAHMGQTGVDGTGWLPINFDSISSGSPIRSLPLDPVNDPSRHLVYIYACNPSKIINGAPAYEVDAMMESQKYGLGGQSDVEGTDGGNDPEVMEMGTDMTLIPKGFYNAVFGGAPSGSPPTAPSPQAGILESSRDARRISDLRSMQVALELYFNKNGCYPMVESTTASPCVGIPGAMTWPVLSSILQNAGIGLNIIPDDPNAASGAHYFYASDGKIYEMGATFENEANPALKSSDRAGNLLSQCKTAIAYCVQP